MSEQPPQSSPTSVNDVETRAPGPRDSQAGSVIGPYRLLEMIGEGGMGEVWLAEQKEPVRRRVALKLIKAGMHTREVVARFQSERQALAMMDHPAIAKVFDAGSTLQGRPFFVMEYVAGMPITAFADKHRLNTRQRLELFIHVCEGVQHAHQKAIIHRDLKPSNILVTEVDGKPVPHIIDFGVAKATSQRLAAGTVYTQFGALIGTLGYMSPEQAGSGGENIDTRTDVYSLGVVLYELLVGTLPHDFQKVAYDEVLRRLREDDAPRPSTKLRTLGGDTVAAAKNRGADPQTLTRQLRGDADSIALKALEKDRNRRYGSPSDLAADIERYLRNEPVAAHPPSAGYRAGKYIRRHWAGVAFACAMALLLVGFTIAQALTLRRITRERDRADRITDFMTGMFTKVDPSNARGNSVTAREVLDKASSDIDTGLRDDPVLQASMMHIMADVYENLGQYQQAESLLRRALEIRRDKLGPADADTLKSAILLALVLDEESRFPEAESLARETANTRTRILGPEDGDTLRSTSTLAVILADEGHYPESEVLNRKILETSQRKFGPRDRLVRDSRTNLAIDLDEEGKSSDAEKLFREVLENDRKQYGDDHPDVLGDMNNLGASLLNQNRYDESEKVYRDVIQIKRRVLGPEHPDTLMSMGSLAAVLSSEKRYEEAEKLYRETLEIKTRKLGEDNRSTLVTAGNMADLLSREGKFAQAELLYDKTLETERSKLGPEHSDTLQTLDGLAALQKKEKRLPEAEKSYREVLGGRQKSLGADHPYTGDAAYDFACVLALEGKQDEAISNLQFATDHALSADNRKILPTDADLNSLHNDPRFAAIAAKAATPQKLQ